MAGEDSSYQGGKLRRKLFRIPKPTPYDRIPATAALRRNPSWVSEMILDPASKLVNAGAQLLVSSLFRKPLATPPPSPPLSVDDMDDLVDLRPPRSIQTSRTQTSGSDPAGDEVVICSPRRFLEAKKMAKKNSRVVEGIDDERVFQTGGSGRSSSDGKKWRRRGRTTLTIADGGCCTKLEDSEKFKAKSVAKGLGTSQSVPQPKDPNFSCPVCMESLVEETSTKCGHIFCKKCISMAIAAQSKCPACRQKLKTKDTFRIYFPTS